MAVFQTTVSPAGKSGIQTEYVNAGGSGIVSAVYAVVDRSAGSYELTHPPVMLTYPSSTQVMVVYDADEFNSLGQDILLSIVN